MLSDFAGKVKKGTREEVLLASIAWDRLPRHVAIIMDGNGRWAAAQGLPRALGTTATAATGAASSTASAASRGPIVKCPPIGSTATSGE